MSLEKQIGAADSSEAGGGGSAAVPEAFWVPIANARSGKIVSAELSVATPPLTSRVAEAVMSREGAGKRLASIIMSPASGIVQNGKMDAWGGARLQLALDGAIQSYPGSLDDLAREVQGVIRGSGTSVEGMERLADLLRGARATAEYVRGNRLPEGSRRFSSLELDVLAKVDLTEVDYGADGKFDEVRFVQVKASPQSAVDQAGEITATHRRLLSSYVPALAAALACAAARAEVSGEMATHGQFLALVGALASGDDAKAALAANPQAHLALRLGLETPNFERALVGAYTRITAAKMVAAARENPVPMFRVIKLARATEQPAMSTLVRTGEGATRFVSVLAGGSQVVGKTDISASFHGAWGTHPTL